MTADLVVDAMGRGAHTPAFLESLGYGRPVEDHIVMHTTYVSQLLRIPPGTLKEMLVLISPAPGRPTGMFLFGYENDTWIFTVFGMVGHEPPRDLAGMLSFAQEYAPAHLLAAVRAGEPLGTGGATPACRPASGDATTRCGDSPTVCWSAATRSVASTRSTGKECRWRRWTLWHCGTVCVAALPTCPDDTSALRRNRLAWPGRLAAGSDLAFPEVEGRRTPSMRVTNRLVDWVLTACESDAVVGAQFFKVTGLVDPPARLLHPAFIYRVATVNLRRRQRDSQPRQAEVAGRADDVRRYQRACRSNRAGTEAAMFAVRAVAITHRPAKWPRLAVAPCQDVDHDGRSGARQSGD